MTLQTYTDHRTWQTPPELKVPDSCIHPYKPSRCLSAGGVAEATLTAIGCSGSISLDSSIFNTMKFALLSNTLRMERKRVFLGYNF